GTVALGASQQLMPKSIPSGSWPRSSAAQAATARPTATAKREFLPEYMSATPRAARHKAVTGFTAARPALQLDSSGNPAHQPISAAVAIVTAAKPATSLACFLFGLPAWPPCSIT